MWKINLVDCNKCRNIDCVPSEKVNEVLSIYPLPYVKLTVGDLELLQYIPDFGIVDLDLSGFMDPDASAVGSGRGREVLSIVRGADLIVIVTDVNVGGILKESLELSSRRTVSLSTLRRGLFTRWVSPHLRSAG